MDQWLNGIAYRVQIGLKYFIIAGVSILLVT